jgi:hypothetical protein
MHSPAQIRIAVFEWSIEEVSICLLESSRAGTYEVAAFREDLGEPLVRSTDVATIVKGVTALIARLDLSRIPPGHYLLAIRLPGIEWSYYPLVVK